MDAMYPAGCSSRLQQRCWCHLGCKGEGTGIRVKEVQLFAKARPKLDSLSLPRVLPWDPVSQFMEQSAIDYVIFRLIFTDLHHGHHERCEFFSLPKGEEQRKETNLRVMPPRGV